MTAEASTDDGPTRIEGSITPTAIAPKAVTIFDEPEHIPNESHLSPQGLSPKIHRASITGKKMTGRPHISHTPSSPGLSRTISFLRLEDAPSSDPASPGDVSHPQYDVRQLFQQVHHWLIEEKMKRSKMRTDSQDSIQQNLRDDRGSHIHPDHDLALDNLEKILSNFARGITPLAATELKPKKSHSQNSLRRGSIAKAFKRSAPPASSDTEWIGEDINVPHVEASLDNTRTLAFTGGATESDDIEAVQQRDAKHWVQFKQDIVRLTHTLKIRGWRRIPIDKGEIILVERLSGALTNAVYVVKPPKEMPEPDSDGSSKAYVSKSKPMELLLRIYGPQAGHLIDRETELGILRRLGRKKIGPRLLGYFTNGRFEEYLHAKTLEAQDLRHPETSKQIAKRMRELHDGIDLLPSEREEGAQCFYSWDKRVDRCEKVMTFLDLQVKREAEGHEPASKRYTRRGLVCGVEWPVFRKAYEKYRKMLTAEYGGEKAVQRRLVFSHNDAQYGNLMRLDPPGDSPLLQPANQHRQLVVIDFEYAGANTPGYEFVNHFSEWTYNYHGDRTWHCNANYYPTRQEQHAFLRAYVMHRPQYVSNASSTPKLEARDRKTSISDFMLDARAPQGGTTTDYDEEEKAREVKMENDIQMLIREARLWRIANAAFWVTWGIVQAKIPELDDPPKKSKTAKVAAVLNSMREHIHPKSDKLDDDVKELQASSKHDRPESREQEEAHAEGDEDEEEEDIEEFDYLAYAQDRAMLFWGDCLQMGIVRREDLPDSLLKQVKILDH